MPPLQPQLQSAKRKAAPPVPDQQQQEPADDIDKDAKCQALVPEEDQQKQPGMKRPALAVESEQQEAPTKQAKAKKKPAASKRARKAPAAEDEISAARSHPLFRQFIAEAFDGKEEMFGLDEEQDMYMWVAFVELYEAAD